MTIMFLSRKPAWFMASYAIPPVMAPSPMTATTYMASIHMHVAGFGNSIATVCSHLQCRTASSALQCKGFGVAIKPIKEEGSSTW